MAKKRGDRLYLREGRGWYGDFRDFRDVGGRQEAMIPPGDRFATNNRDTAATLLAARLKELKELRSGRSASDPFLREYAKRHLEIKAQYRRASTVARDELSLRHVLEYFGEDVRLSQVTVERLTDYVLRRSRQPGKREGTKTAPQTILHELHALSSLYKRAVAEKKAVANPVAMLPDKPSVAHAEATWLEIGEAARYLEKARDADADPSPRALPYLEALFAAFLLTGGRRGEVFGFELRDIDFDNDVVHFRHNAWRRLKREHHPRWVPLWPQLREILARYMGCSSNARTGFSSLHLVVGC
jgi:integrase